MSSASDTTPFSTNFEMIFEMTKSAEEQFRKAMQDEDLVGHGVRVVATRVSKTRMTYALDFVAPDEGRDDDVVWVGGEGLMLHFDPQSAQNLKGGGVDYVDNGYQSGFKFNNPNTEVVWVDPLAQRLQTLLDAEINPSLASHGGYIDLVDMKDGRAFVVMGGGCQGCGQASATLREGVEKQVLAAIPEIKELVDQTDHNAGANPYYA